MGLSYWDLFFGRRPGVWGGLCPGPGFRGAVFIVEKIYFWGQAPAGFIVTLGALSCAFGAAKGYFQGDFLFSILSGGVILRAFFIITDYVTTPLTKKGQLVFGAGCGRWPLLSAAWRLSRRGVLFHFDNERG